MAGAAVDGVGGELSSSVEPPLPPQAATVASGGAGGVAAEPSSKGHGRRKLGMRSAATFAAEAAGLFPALERSCNRCDDRRKNATNRCKQCRAAWYCSRDCQRADWKEHKVTCRPPAKGDEPPPSFAVVKEKPTVDDFAINATDIGAGNFSRVMRAVHRRTREVFALKQMEKQKISRMAKRHPNIHNEVLMERAVLTRLDHPHIAKLFHTFQDQICLYFLSEYVAEGELWSRLVEDERMVGCGATYARYFGIQLVDVIEYLHANGVAHRDIKPENVMVTASGAIKLVDFGTAKDMVDPKLNGKEFVGTPDYMPPEIINSKVGGPAHDLWSLGCTLYQMLVGRQPFKTASAYLTFQRIQAMDLQLPSFLTEVQVDLLSRLLREEPSERLGMGGEAGDFEQLRNHPFFEDSGWPGRTPVKSLQELSLVAAARALCSLSSADDAVRAAGGAPEAAASVAARPGSAALDRTVARETITTKMSPAMREALRHAVALRKGLASPTVHSLFFEDDNGARFRRAGAGLGFGRDGRGYIGLESEDEGQWDAPFLFVIVSDPRVGAPESTSARALVETVERLNGLDPLPRFVVVVGDVTAAAANPGDSDAGTFAEQLSLFKRIMSRLDARVAIVVVPGRNTVGAGAGGLERHQAAFGDPYFSFWCGGVRGFVVCSELLVSEAEAPAGARRPQASWLKREMAATKYGAQHQCVFAQVPFVQPETVPTPQAGAAGGEAATIEGVKELGADERVRVRALLRMRHHNARAVFTGGSENSLRIVGKRGAPVWRKHYSTPVEDGESDSAGDASSSSDEENDGEEHAAAGSAQSADGAAESKGAESGRGGDAGADKLRDGSATAPAVQKRTRKKKEAREDAIASSTQVVQTRSLAVGEPSVRVVQAFLNHIEHESFVLSELPSSFDMTDEDAPKN